MQKRQITPHIYIIDDFFSFIKTDITTELINQCAWEDFTINGKVLCRKGSFQGDQLKNDCTPWLRCPSIERQVIYPFTNIVTILRQAIRLKLNYKANIAKIQKYDVDSYISPHVDKIIDLDPESPILIGRFGGTRRCTLTNKVTDEIINVNVKHNSLLVIEYEGNLIWRHGILPLAPAGIFPEEDRTDSYSIVFRNSVTFRHTNTNLVFGVNTPFKTFEDLSLYLDSDESRSYYDSETQSKKIIDCYKTENKTVCTIDLYKDIIENAIFAF